MEFKKIDVSEEAFKEIARRLCWNLNDYGDIHQEYVERALERAIFNVKAEFKEDGWNRCTVKPPENYRDVDLLIRPKNVPRHGGECLTTRHTAYKVGYCGSITGKFMCKGKNVFDSESCLQEYEYKVIK